MNSRWKNKGLWISIAGLVYYSLDKLGFKIDLGEYNYLVNTITFILITAGILSNPTDSTGYIDKGLVDKQINDTINIPPKV